MAERLEKTDAVEYRAQFQGRAWHGLALLPEDSAIAEMLSDCPVMREGADLPTQISGIKCGLGSGTLLDLPSIPSESDGRIGADESVGTLALAV